VRILVTGAAGMVGSDLVLAADAVGVDAVAVTREGLDLTDEGAAAALVAEVRPDVVVNCAAFTAVDRCESEPRLAHEVNEHGARRLARACASVGSRLVHLSTDYVFDGRLDRPYREDDEPNPQSVYGRSKLAGERAVAEVLGDAATVVRTSWVCGEHGGNMVATVLRLADRLPPGEQLAFVDDQRGHPTFAADLAPALLALAAESPGGIVHLTNAGVVSWYGFVRHVLAATGRSPAEVDAMVRPITTADLDPPRPAPRPANSVLANRRWTELGHEPLRHFSEPLAELVRRLR
jgi:dTDP-4-dehydrorhamnose reductase